MKFFNIIKANAEIKELSTKITELTAHVEQLTKENESLKQQSAALPLASQAWATEKENLVKAHEEALKALEEKYKTDTKELAQVIEETKVSVNEQAAHIVSSIGIEPETIKVSPEPTEADVAKRFASLKGEERSKYYQSHREEIHKALGIKP